MAALVKVARLARDKMSMRDCRFSLLAKSEKRIGR